MKIHAVNVIVGGIPADKRKKISVTLVLVQARDKEHALQVAARGFSTHDNFADYSFMYRNEFDEGPITWTYQTWERFDMDGITPLSGEEILGVKPVTVKAVMESALMALTKGDKDTAMCCIDKALEMVKQDD
jgi:hypothetical protein